MFEILDRAFMLFGCGSASERSQILAAARLRILFARVEAILT
jgi:hypothetical protein